MIPMRRDINQTPICRRAAAGAAIVTGWIVLFACAGSPQALALDTKAEEKAALKVCEKRFCEIVLGHDAKKPADFQCGLSKTWTKRNIKDNVDGKTSAWSLGDARCSSTVSVPRGPILEVLTAGKHTIEFEPHTVHCEVENDKEITTIDVTVGPKIEFKDGRATRAWIKLKKVDGPGTWKATLWTLAKVEDTLGLFQKDVLKSINKLIHETCPATYTAPAVAEPAKPAAKPAAAKPAPGAAKAAESAKPAAAAKAAESKKQ